MEGRNRTGSIKEVFVEDPAPQQLGNKYRFVYTAEDFDGTIYQDEVEVYAQGYTQANEIVLSTLHPLDYSFLGE